MELGPLGKGRQAKRGRRMSKSERKKETRKGKRYHDENALGPDHKDGNTHWKPSHWLATAHCFDVKQM